MTSANIKTLAYLCAALAAWVSGAQAQAVVRPLIAAEFGVPIVVEAQFVAKPNNYYEQNMISEPYLLKVVAVNGKSLKKPAVIEYKLQMDEKSRAKLERPGEVLTFEAYESLYQPPMATPWLAAGQQGMSFVLRHVLHLRRTSGLLSSFQ